jgi:hypothetical protein
VRLALSAVLVAVLALAAVPASGSALADGWRECRPISGVEYRYVTARKVTCRYARRTLRRMQRHGDTAPWPKWSCTDTYKRLFCANVDRSGRAMSAAWLDET